MDQCQIESVSPVCCLAGLTYRDNLSLADEAYRFFQFQFDVDAKKKKKKKKTN
jgi:hypothetical protein